MKLNKVKYFAMALSFLFGCTGIVTELKAETIVPTVISKSEAWTPGNNPYVIDNNITIEEGVTLTIAPGVIINSFGFPIFVKGCIDAKGDPDAFINFNNTELVFFSTTTSYNPATGKGLQFNFCNFTTARLSSFIQMRLVQNAIRINHCVFTDILSPLFSVGPDSTKIWVNDSKFIGDKIRTGTVLTGMRSKSLLDMQNCTVHNYGSIGSAEVMIIKNCILGGNKISPNIVFTQFARKAIISCNLIKNGGTTGVQCSNLAPGSKVEFINNEFDSLPTFFTLNCTGKYDTQVVRNNNFVRFSKASIDIIGCNNGAVAYTWLDFKENYWGTTDTTWLFNTMNDNRSNPKIIYRINISNVLKAPVKPCWPGGSSAVGIGNLPKQDNVTSLFPVPATNKLTLATNNEVSLGTIYNIHGQMVLQGLNLFNGSTIDIENLKQGTYILEIRYSSGKTERIKFLKA